MGWTLRLVEAEMDGQSRSCDVMVISRPDNLGEIANSGDRARGEGLTLAEAKQLLVSQQQEVVAAQAHHHAMFRPNRRSCGGTCHVKIGGSWCRASR
jgi:hypothetical protein